MSAPASQLASPFRVCYLLKRYPRISQTFVLNEMLELERQGVEVVVAALKDSGEPIVQEKTSELKAPVHYLPSSRADEALANLIREARVDHIHAHFAGWAAGAAARVSTLTGVPFSFTAHARDIHHESVDRTELAKKIEAALFVITVSDFNRRCLEEALRVQGRTGRIIRLYNGIDLKQFRSSRGRREPGLVVGVGRLVEKKGFHDLIEACGTLIQREGRFRCVIVGEGEERVSLQAQIDRFGLADRVELAGRKSQEQVMRIVRRAQVFVLPCIVSGDGDRDGLPTVLLEAMALGTPVVSTRVAGISELVRHGQSGLLVDERDPNALAEAIERLLTSRRLRAGMSRRARSDVRRRFRLDANVATLKSYLLSGGTLP